MLISSAGSQVAKGTFKMFGLRKMMDYSILQKREKNNEALSMQRLYKHLLVNVFNGMNAFKTINLENMKDDGKVILSIQFLSK